MSRATKLLNDAALSIENDGTASQVGLTSQECYAIEARLDRLERAAKAMIKSLKRSYDPIHKEVLLELGDAVSALSDI